MFEEEDSRIILECKNCAGSGIVWENKAGTGYKEMITCPVCKGDGVIAIGDSNIVLKKYKSYEDTVEDAKKICKRWVWLENQYEWMLKQLVKKNNIDKYDNDENECIIYYNDVAYHYDIGNEDFSRYDTKGKTVFIDWENYEKELKNIPDDVQKFAAGYSNFGSVVYGEMSEYADLLGYYFEWEEYSCSYLGDAYQIEMSCYELEYNPNHVEIEYVLGVNRVVNNLHSELKNR